MFSFFKKKNNKFSFPRILLIADKPNWAYDSIAKSIVKYNRSNLYIDIDYIKKPIKNLKKNHKNYDLIFVLGWQLLAHLKNEKITEDISYINKEKLLTGIHSHHSWDNKRTKPNFDVNPPKELIAYLKSFKGVNCVSKKLFNIFKVSGLENLSLTENGVDTQLFKQKKNFFKNKKLNLGFSGNSQNHDWRKGFSEFIIPASKINNVNLIHASKSGDNLIKLENMPNFYEEIDLYICASSSEGFSLSVLEASATGIPIISTKVGGCEDLIQNNYNGFLVDRDISSIKEKIIFLKENPSLLIKMGNNNRSRIENNWSWKIKINHWIDFIESFV